jgi:cyclin H
MADEGLLGGLQAQAAKSRIGKAADKAKALLRTAAQMTDAYFHYTPSQIWLGALLANDADLVTTYINLKLETLGEAGLALRDKLIQTVSSCAELLGSYTSPEDDPAERKQMKRIGRKLHVCQNPEKLDIVAVTKAKAAEKREGSEGSDMDKKSKKRKLEREKLERDGDVFGGDLKSTG